MNTYPVEIEIECGPRFFCVEGHIEWLGFCPGDEPTTPTTHVDTVSEIDVGGTATQLEGEALAAVLAAHQDTFLAAIEQKSEDDGVAAEEARAERY